MGFGNVSKSSEVEVDAIQDSISDFPILPETISLDRNRAKTAGGVVADLKPESIKRLTP